MNEKQLLEEFRLTIWGEAPKGSLKYSKGLEIERFIIKKLREKEQKIILLQSDIHRAIGFIQGLGHHDKYLEKKYGVS